MSELAERFETHDPGEKQVAEKIRCDACPVMCYIADGRTGACDRYGNVGGRIVRMDPLTILDHATGAGGAVVPFAAEDEAWDGELVNTSHRFVTAIGAGTTYPDYKPAPFIVSQEVEGVDLVTVVTEGIFSYCGVKVKIDTDRHLGPETATVRAEGEAIGHVTTGEYGSQMLSLGGVHHLTGGSKAEGRATCDALLNLCNRKPVELVIDGGATIIVEAGKPPVIDGKLEHRMRVGCGSATIGMFATQWRGLVDEVVVVDDHITGVVSEHQAGKVLGWQDTGIKIIGRRSTPGRYFKVSEPGLGWGGTSISDPLSILGEWNAKKGARPGLSLLMVSTTGEQFAYYELDDDLKPVEKPFPGAAAEIGRPDRGQLRAGALHRAVHRRRRRLAARRCHREPGQPHPFGARPDHLCDGRRRAGLCLAGRRHHADGRCHPRAGRRLRLCADAGAGGADRVHLAPRRLCQAGRLRSRDPQRRRHRCQGRRVSQPAP